MARPKRKIEARDYDKLIQESESKIEKLVLETKEERTRLRDLKKAKELYDLQVAEEKKQEELQKIMDMIVESGKGFDEIEAFFNKPVNKKTEK